MEQKLDKCIKAQLMASQQDGAYKIYVFQDQTTGEFIMCSRCPNWRGDEPEELQEGFVHFKHVEGGKDTYFDARIGQFVAYQYSATYFLSFVPITHVLKDGFVINKNKLKIA